MKVIEQEHLPDGYDVIQDGDKFYGVHTLDQPFFISKIDDKINVRPVFIGDSKPEVLELLKGARQTIDDLVDRPEIMPGMVFDGYATIDYMRQKLKLIVETQEVPQHVEDGHFYSPVPSLDDIRRYAALHFIGVPRTMDAIDMNEEEQKALLDFLVEEYRTHREFLREHSLACRYFYRNEAFSYHDAFVLRSFMRYFKPKRMIEVGSGFSSCVMIDTNEQDHGGSIDITHIEPYPDLLWRLTGEDVVKRQIIAKPLQEVELDLFQELGKDDILFIDTSHVSKLDSDVNFYLFEIFPRLRPGVVIHIHDIGLNFDYEIGDLLKGRAWNESYALRAFLMYNKTFRILFWNPFMLHFYPKIHQKMMPLCWQNPGGSIWLRKMDGN